MTRPTLTAIPRGGALPVSPTQAERLETGRDTYLQNSTVTVTLRFSGPLDLDVLARSVGDVVARHEALRVVFPTDDRAALCEPTEPLRVAEIPPGTDEPETTAVDLLTADAMARFDLATGPLFRCLAVRVDERTHLLGFAVDHIIADGWSCGLLVRDLLACYEAHLHGESPELAPLTVQHLDYVAWERDYLAGPDGARLLDYWRAKLGPVAPIPESGLVDPDADGPPALDRVRVDLDGDFRRTLTRFAASHRTTPYAVVSAAVVGAVHGQRGADDDVALFASLSNRTHAAVQDVFGYFATPTALRTYVGGDPTFSELVGRQAETVADAIRHQEIPHAVLLKELRPPQYGSRYRGDAPLYLNFDLDQDRARPFGFGVRGLTAALISLPRPEAPRGGLRLLAHQHESGLTLELRFRTDVYGKPWATRLADRAAHLLRSGTTDPAQTVAALNGKLP
ncbi:condensation domain-containing protein [Actinokineospora sp. HUAS TT18]|uniref:condensation domain-containing protein n=1 Tax=Actinokineospora sp. HUAS TT18 TaxID=3447451 RepID=UPI003F524349